MQSIQPYTTMHFVTSSGTRFGPTEMFLAFVRHGPRKKRPQTLRCVYYRFFLLCGVDLAKIIVLGLTHPRQQKRVSERCEIGLTIVLIGGYTIILY